MGAKGPGSKSSRKREGHRAKRPGSVRAKERKFQGANWPGSNWPIRSGSEWAPGAKRLGTIHSMHARSCFSDTSL